MNDSHARPWRFAASIILLLLTGLAGVIRFWRLDAIPPGFHYDEALEALEAWRVLTQPDYRPVFFPGDFGLPALFIYLSSAAFQFLPLAPATSRGIAALIGVLTVPAVYLLGRELTLADDGLPAGLPLASAALLAIMRWHITFSRVAIEPILVPLFLVLILWSLLYGLRTNRWLAWLGLGAALGLSIYAYPAAWLLPLLVLGVAVFLALTARHHLAGRWRGLIVAGSVAALVAAPLAAYFFQHPAQWLMRSSQVSILASGSSVESTLTAVGRNLLRTLGMFSVAGDIDPRSNIPGRAALDPLMQLPFYLGLLLALRRWKRLSSGILLLAAAAMLATTVFSQYAPNFRRSLGVTPIIALLAGYGLATMAQWWRRGLGLRRFGPWLRVGLLAAVLAILLGSTAINLHAYFVEWANSPDLFYAYDEGLWAIGEYVRDLPPAQAILITPRPQKDATLAFAWRDRPAVRHFDGRHALIVPPPGGDSIYIVIEHEDFRGSALLRDLHPDLVEVKRFADRQAEVYARAFQVGTGAALARQPTFSVASQWPGIELIGYSLHGTAFSSGQIIPLELWWRATAEIETDWTVFTHLLGPQKADGSILWAGRDGRPGQGSVPTTTWQPGELILDEYLIQLPEDMPAGEYSIEVGLYDLAGGGVRALTTEPAAQDHLIIGAVRIE